MKYYYTNAQNQPTGPVESAELASLAAQNLISDQTPVIPEGSQTWTTYGAVRQAATPNAAAEAVAAGMGRAVTAFKDFSWGHLLFGLLLTLIGFLCLPWTVLKSGANELAGWGSVRTLPLESSDFPVLTFFLVIMRNVALVCVAFIAVLAAFYSLFTGRGMGSSSYYDSGWHAGYAFGGFVLCILLGYFVQVFIALSFELASLGVRIANHIKIIAKK